MKAFKNLLIVLAAAAGVLLFIGFVQPAEGTTRVSVLYRKPVPEIWATVYDFEKWSQWNPSVKRISSVSQRNFHPTWSIDTGSGLVPLEVVSVELNKKIETLSEKKWVQTRWTWGFRGVPAGTELTITEVKTVKNLLLRGFLALRDASEPIEQMMIGLGNRHELKAEPKEVEVNG